MSEKTKNSNIEHDQIKKKYQTRRRVAAASLVAAAVLGAGAEHVADHAPSYSQSTSSSAEAVNAASISAEAKAAEAAMIEARRLSSGLNANNMQESGYDKGMTAKVLNGTILIGIAESDGSISFPPAYANAFLLATLPDKSSPQDFNDLAGGWIGIVDHGQNGAIVVDPIRVDTDNMLFSGNTNNGGELVLSAGVYASETGDSTLKGGGPSGTGPSVLVFDYQDEGRQFINDDGTTMIAGQPLIMK